MRTVFPHRRLLGVAILLVLPWAGVENLALAADDGPAAPLKDAFAGLELRTIGPAVTSGRITDFAVYPGKPSEFFAATASGGLWKTANDGTTWTPVFDGEASYSIGVVELDPTDSKVVWVGSGENNSQRSVAYGDGVYKSIDGGKSWKRAGLENSEHIGQIVIDPRDSDVVYVAAHGPLWNAGGDRGLYKTTDGGQSWKRILYIDENTGINEVVQNARDPDVMVASSYQRRRHLWVLIDGGPGGGIHRTSDGGANWLEVTSGLPEGDMGRIGLAAAPSDSDILYAVIEAAPDEQGIYRSGDAGVTWEKRSDHMATSPQYYNELVVDPHNPDRVYLMDTLLSVSEDGGKTWTPVGVKYKHVDEHALWIDPANTDHLLAGNDGGIYETYDRGENWRHMRNLPITQFYRASPDNDYPFYGVWGGTQDNSSLGAPSRTFNDMGIANEDWTITMGGDGFKSQVDPENANIIYAQLQYGNLARFDKTTGERVYITPQPARGEDSYRWNWNSALIISPHNKNRLYYAAERIFRSDDQGDSWRAVSGDLTRQIDRNRLEVMGRVWSVDAIAKNDSTSIWGSIIALSESPLVEGLIYAGTDDGLIQVTEDGGGTWRKTDSFRGVPDISYVGDVVASLHDAGVVYATFDNHKRGDFKPYVLKSTDRGRSWRSIAGNLPARGSAHTIVQDHVDPDLLFVGTEFGLFVTQNGGQSWAQLKGGFPTIAVRDLEIQRRESDLVIASFGRGIWILDDYSPLRTKLADITASEATLFPVKDALLYAENARWVYSTKGAAGEEYYTAPNPPFGAVISYHLKDGLMTARARRQKAEAERKEAGEDNPYPGWDALHAEDREEDPAILITVRDGEGNVVRRLSGPVSKGFHRVAWDLRYAAIDPVSLAAEGYEQSFFGDLKGPYAAPGNFSVTIAKRVDGKVSELAGPAGFTVTALKRGLFQADDLLALAAYHRDVAALARAVAGAGAGAKELQARIDHMKKGMAQTAAVSEEQNAQLRTIEMRLKDALLLLDGDATRSSRNEQAPASINDRLQWFRLLQWNTLSRVPPNLERSLEVAGQDYAEVQTGLKSVAADMAVLERAVGADVPWTPGRIPEWRPGAPAQ